MLCKTLNQKEKKFILRIQIYAICLKCELITLVEEEELLKRNCPKPNVMRGGFLKNKKILLSEAKSELDRQELRVRSGMQLQSQRMELYQVNQLSGHSQREKSWLCTELGQKRKTSSRSSYEQSSGDTRIEKDVLYRG